MNFKVIDNVLSDKHVKNFIKHDYKPRRVQSSFTNIDVYNLETYNKDRAVPYYSCIQKQNKISGKNSRDSTGKEHRSFLNGCVLFKRSDCSIVRSCVIVQGRS